MTTVYVHGGVAGQPKDDLPSLATSIPEALGATGALDAVELAVRALEDDPRLNAGWGSVLNRDGGIELDAGIVDGATGRCGGVAGVAVRHPISLARRVLEDTPHVLLTGTGGRALGTDMTPLDASTQEQHERWRRASADGSLSLEDYARPDHVDTVGAVALDDGGHLAAGSSTGGVFGQMPGRVGDAPIFGAGVYASAGAAVVGSGVGELFLETLACARAGRLIEEGMDPQSACEQVIAYLGSRSPASAALLALDSSGDVGAAFRGGSWAVEGREGAVRATGVR
ncbi:MAG: isoaspartyl peptidase/L-asparaginase [Actinobacteria bacterium]|nr:isoaspartyl peptidase/L-asparaginase [Actinomycetota bacterium]